MGRPLQITDSGRLIHILPNMANSFPTFSTETSSVTVAEIDLPKNLKTSAKLISFDLILEDLATLLRQ
jgi:hypothetical protein